MSDKWDIPQLYHEKELRNYFIPSQASQTHDSRNRSNIYDLSTRIE